MDRRVCERKGWIWLFTESGRRVSMETTCKTWGCKVCEKQMLALFRLRVKAGISHLQACVFTTFTFKMGDVPVDAVFVTATWKEFSRRWKKAGEENFEWLKVVELTKKGQPHLHLVMGPTTGRICCYGRLRPLGKWFVRDRSCKCLSHRLSRVWEAVTGDSWIVYCVPVTSPDRAGNYLLKYMAKGMGKRGNLEALGFKRRWSTSRGWPGKGRIRLRQSLPDGPGWAHTELHVMRMAADNPEDLEVRVGPEWAMKNMERVRQKTAVGKMRRKINATDESSSINAKGVGPG